MRNSLVLVIVVLLEVVGNTVLSHGMRSMGEVVWSSNVAGIVFHIMSQPAVIIGILILLLYFLFFLTALSRMDLSYVLPMTASSYILTSLSASIFLHEKIALMQWAGTLLICCGLFLVNQSERKARAAPS